MRAKKVQNHVIIACKISHTKNLYIPDMWLDPPYGSVISVDLEGNYWVGCMIPLDPKWKNTSHIYGLVGSGDKSAALVAQPRRW